MSKVTQQDKILRYLEVNNWISPYDAWSLLNITKLSTRVGEMIRGGVPIIKKRVEYYDDQGNYGHYTAYSLQKSV